MSTLTKSTGWVMQLLRVFGEHVFSIFMTDPGPPDPAKRGAKQGPAMQGKTP